VSGQDPAASARILQAFDLALLQTASRFDLASQDERNRSARWLAEMYVRLVTRVLKPEVVLELGAHSAWFSRVVRKKLPEAAIHALEANPYNVQRFSGPAIAEGVAYHHLAVGDEVKDCVFKITRSKDGVAVNPGRGSNSLRTKPADIEYEDAAVSMVTVDHFLQSQGLAGRNCALWIDVEGCAFEVIAGARTALENTLALMVEVEDREFWTGQKTAGEVKRALFAAGMIPVARDFEFKGQYNMVFVRPDVFERWDVREFLERNIAPPEPSAPQA
jgi:FkbM family methyltransferase